MRAEDTQHTIDQPRRGLIEAVRDETAVAGFDVAGGLSTRCRTPFLPAEAVVDKASTAASFRPATHAWSSLVTETHVAALVRRPRLTVVGGGVPAMRRRCAYADSDHPAEPPGRTRTWHTPP